MPILHALSLHFPRHESPHNSSATQVMVAGLAAVAAGYVVKKYAEDMGRDKEARLELEHRVSDVFETN